MNYKLSGLSNKSEAELVEILKAIPAGVTTLDLSKNHLEDKPGAELVQALSVIPVHIKINYGNEELQRKYDINYLLDSYLENKTTSNAPEYRHGGFFPSLQKSLSQKREAIDALRSALNGNNVDLSRHLLILRNGSLGKGLRAFVKSGMGDTLVGKKVTTVSDFIDALQEKVSNQAQPL